MFRLFNEIDHSTLDQDTVIDKFNLLADAFRDIGYHFQPLNQKGVCAGLSANYLLFAHEGSQEDEFLKRDEFFRYLAYIHSLTETKIRVLVEKYHQSQKQGSELLIRSDFGDIQFSRLLEFFKVIQDTQADKNNLIQVMGANWDRSYTIFCDLGDLKNELNNARIQEGKLIWGSLGLHIFAIEKTEEGYYLFEPNNFKLERPLLKTVEDVADTIIENIAHSHFNSPFNTKIALTILFVSYGDENREFDDLFYRFENEIRAFDLQHDTTIMTTLIHSFRDNALSRADFALMLHDVLSQTPRLSHKLIELELNLKMYLAMKGITQEQAAIDDMLKTNKSYSQSSAYTFSISSLYLATQYNQITLVKKLLAHDAPLELANEDGYTPLHIAAQNENIVVTQLLLEQGANPNQPNFEGMTPLHLAVQNGNADIVTLLLRHHADTNLAGAQNTTPIYLAAQDGKLDVAILLLEHGAKLDTSISATTSILLEHAKKMGRLNEVKALLSKKETYFIHYFMPMASQQLSGFTPLHAAVFFGHSDVASLLLENGADINRQSQGITALDFAIAMGQKDMIALLESKQQIGIKPHH